MNADPREVSADEVTALRTTAHEVFDGTRLPGACTDEGVDLLSGVVLTWRVLGVAVANVLTCAAMTRRYRMEAAIRAGLSLPVWEPHTWEENVGVLAFPGDHPLHPGGSWEREAVPGGVLAMGVGASGLDSSDPERVLPLHPLVLDACGFTLTPSAWALLRTRHEQAGATAGGLFRVQRPSGFARLRQFHRMDVVTLLASARYRAEVARSSTRHQAGGGRIVVAAPTRSQGWMPTYDELAEATEVMAVTSQPEDRGLPVWLTLTDAALAAA